MQENYQKMDFTEENGFDTVYVMERPDAGGENSCRNEKSLRIRPVGRVFPDQRIYTGGKWQLDRGQCNPS